MEHFTQSEPADSPFAAPRSGERGLSSIVIVTYNGLALTRLCLGAVARHTPERHEVVLVDNGSTDGTADALAGQPNVRIFRNGRNLGFPAGANVGIRAAAGGRIVLLNNDVVVTPGWMRRLSDALESAPDVAMVGPCSNCVSGCQQVPVGYVNRLGTDGGVAVAAEAAAFAAVHAARHEGQTEAVDRLVGFCLMFRRELVDRIGLLDERFGIGNFEDDDYCRRARAAGYRLLVAKECFVHHFGSATFRASGIDHRSLMRRNEALFRQKWATPATSGARGPLDTVPGVANSGQR